MGTILTKIYENIKFIEGTPVMHGYQCLHGAILTKMIILDNGHYLFYLFGIERLT